MIVAASQNLIDHPTNAGAVSAVDRVAGRFGDSSAND
jgi:hypothetical protein